MTEYKLRMNVWESNTTTTIYAVRGETESRKLIVTLYDRSGELGEETPVSLADTAVKIFILKPDGESRIMEDGTVENEAEGTVSFLLDEAMLNQYGKAECELWLIKTDQSVLKVKGLTLLIQPSIIPEEEIAASDDFRSLVEALSMVESLTNEEEERQAAESVRVQAEEQRKSQEQQRQAAELERQSSFETMQETVSQSSSYAQQQGDYAKEQADRLEGVDLSSLTGNVTALQENVSSLQDSMDHLQSEDTALQEQITAISQSKGIANGIASLDQSGKLIASQLPFETGSWTPVMRTAESENSAVINYTSQVGTYYRIGRLVYIFCSLTGSIDQVQGMVKSRITGIPVDAAEQSALNLTTVYNCLAQKEGVTAYISQNTIVFTYTSIGANSNYWAETGDRPFTITVSGVYLAKD